MLLSRSLISVKIPTLKPAFAIRNFSLDFQPLPEKYLNDPLDETAWSALGKYAYH